MESNDTLFLRVEVSTNKFILLTVFCYKINNFLVYFVFVYTRENG